MIHNSLFSLIGTQLIICEEIQELIQCVEHPYIKYINIYKERIEIQTTYRYILPLHDVDTSTTGYAADAENYYNS